MLFPGLFELSCSVRIAAELDFNDPILCPLGGRGWLVEESIGYAVLSNCILYVWGETLR